jgi:hypothetical protein
VAVGRQLEAGRLRDQAAHRRIAEMSWVALSWAGTASSTSVESKAGRVRPRSTPVAATTSGTTSKMRLDRWL